MTRIALTTAAVAAVAAFTLSGTGPAEAQSASWEFAVSPYAWLPGISTSTDTDFGDVGTDSNTREVVEDLDFAFMGTIEARNGRWGLILDLINADLTSSEDTPLGLLWSEAQVETSVGAFTTYAGYRVFEDAKGAVDVLGGARFFSLDIKTSLTPGTLAGRSENASSDWADPVIGLRGRYDFTDKWFTTGVMDFGGYEAGSNRSWQLFASVGYQFNEHWSMQGAWRYMAIEKEINGRDVEVDLNGPLVGFTYRF